MRILEQIKATEALNQESRLRYRQLTAKAGDVVRVIGHNGLGDVLAVVDTDGENWIEFKVDFL